MRFVTAALLSSLSLGALAAQPPLDLPSCNLPAQRALQGQVDEHVTDPGQAHIYVRADALVGDINALHLDRQLTEQQASKLLGRVNDVRAQTDGFVKEQGFLSAAERASFDREFDAVAKDLCPRTSR
ncbi:hypothetical protein IFR09_12465 [Pseudomonas syringae]|nr:hypothetical protein [Pseudomonas syringae]MBD8792996.1 hypothetical protein [Pseudomonas syringae]MBD8803661.1 hypothetical protein [Pseudomonas syringae]MBD8811974.1 hypothetical protein [Pseudomonas syringae]